MFTTIEVEDYSESGACPHDSECLYVGGKQRADGSTSQQYQRKHYHCLKCSNFVTYSLERVRTHTQKEANKQDRELAYSRSVLQAAIKRSEGHRKAPESLKRSSEEALEVMPKVMKRASVGDLRTRAGIAEITLFPVTNAGERVLKRPSPQVIESASSDEASEESEDDSLTPQGYDPLPGEQVQILHCKKGHWYGLVVGRGEDTSFAKNSPKEAAINIQWLNKVANASVKGRLREGEMAYYPTSKYQLIPLSSVTLCGHFMKIQQNLKSVWFIVSQASSPSSATEEPEEDEHVEDIDITAPVVTDEVRAAGEVETAREAASPQVLAEDPMRLLPSADSISNAWLRLAFPIVSVEAIDREGNPVLPRFCNKAREGQLEHMDMGACAFINFGYHEKKKPLLTADGPVILRINRLRCNAHGGDFVYAPFHSHLLEEGQSLSPFWLQFGESNKNGPKISPGFLAKILMSYINSRFVIASTRRELLISWSSTILDKLATYGGCGDLNSVDQVMAALERLVPHEASIASMIRTIWNQVQLPKMEERDKIMAQVEGQVIKYDSTFRIAKGTYARVGSRRVKVATAVETITGKNNGLLCTPRLCPHEDLECILEGVKRVCQYRRDAFGEQGAPIAIVTDNIRRDHVQLRQLVGRMFPETSSKPGKATLLCQDIIHRLWHFTRTLPKTHPDYGFALRDIKALFYRFLLPYPRTPPGKEVEDASVFPASAATEIGLALHSGGELSEGTCKVLTRSLTAMGYSFRYHAVWKSLTVCPPHEALIRRLARVVGVQLPTSTGYASKEDFVREIRGWEAWYSITRSDCGIRDKLAEERVQRLIDSIGESSGSEAESEEDEDGSPEAISSSTAATARKTPLRGSVPDAEALASSLPPGVGISSHPKISEAVRNAVVDVIVEGLLANQHLVGLPKGTCSNEACHSFLRHMVHPTVTSVDMTEVVLGLCRLCYDESTIRRDTLGSVNNGNRLFAAQSAAVRSLLEIATAQGSTAFNFLSIAKGKPIRTLVELNEAGYTVRDSVKDPFSKRDAIAVLKAVQSVQQHGSKVMGDYTDLYRWISVTILGGTREPNAVEEYIRKEIYGHGGRYANLHRHGGPQFPLAADSETGVVTSKPTDTVPAHHVRQ